MCQPSARRMTGWPVENTSLHKRLFLARNKGTEPGDYFSGVDGHAMGNNSRWGRICLLNAALTVETGSLTTWLRRSLRATLHKM